MFGCTIPPNCAVNVTSWTNYATGANTAAPAAYPVQVKDQAGTVLVINSLSAIPDCNTSCPTITLTTSNQTNVLCNGGTTGKATVTAAGGQANYTYTWSPGNLTGNTQTTLAAGTYTVSVTDANNCPGSTTVTITEPTALSAVATVTQNEDCGQHNGAITSSASGGTSPYIYSWSNGAGTQNISSVGAGNYTVTVTDANNCTATASVSVTNTSGLTATATVTQNEDCGQHNGAITSSASGGTSPYTYSWSNGAGTQNISSVGAGNYTVTVTDANNCTATATASVTNQGGFTVQSQITQPTCQSTAGSISLTPSGGTAPYTYTWSNSASGSSISNLAPGNYTVEIKDATGCIENKTYTISSVPIAASIVITGDTVLCNGQSVILTASGGVSYTWSTGETSNSITVSPQSTTVIGVEGTDINGCIGKDSTQITVLPTLSAGFTNSPNGGGAPLNVAFTNTSSNSTSYNWNFGNGQTNSTTNPTINVTYDMPGEYTITLIASNGLCTDTTYGTIKVDSFPEIQIHVPNVFTPNGDGINDVYSIETQYAKSVYVEIFNRWGNLMVKLETPIATWDGGKSSDGVYFYKYKIVDYYDKTHEGSGFFHLTRGK
jgi:gliding motility-associated-like protein